ncbi:MAG TPA: Crp/Fnr family transcriptional regulator [Candidatus Enterenecus merdae]|nr:Crp/Fnr family transcriptional regulator [Candidatus Enterenecus merdae]
MVPQQVKNHPLLCRVEEPLRAQVLAAAQLLEVAKGETVYDRRHFRRCLGIVLQGRIQVRKQSLLISTLLEGDVFGAAALFNASPDFPTTMTALSPCKLLLIPQEGVRRMLRECPAFAEDYVGYLSQRIRFLSARLGAVSADSAQEKLARYLLGAEGGRGEVCVSATRLSALIGVGRATLYRAFAALERAGAIRREGKAIRILDRAKLQF